MPTLDPRLLPLVLAATAGIVVVLSLAMLRRAFRRWRLRSRFAHARAGEHKAGRLLLDRGYEILARQSSTTWQVRVDGEQVDVDLRADYLVARGGRTLVAEVKTGKLATSIDSAATRRQLLEYRCAFGADGVLLVDADRGTVREVVFVLPQLESRSGWGTWAMAATAVAAVIYVIARAS